MSSIMKGLIGEVGSSSSEDFMHRLKSTMKVNPKGSASEKMVLQRYIMTPMVQDMNLSGKDWITQAAKWLQGNKEKLEQKFPDLDLSDIVGLAEKMYEDFLAMQGQLEECGVGYELNPFAKKVDETHSTGTTAGSAGIGGGAGLGITKSPMEKVIEKPLGEGNLPPKAGFNKNPHKVGPGNRKDD